MKTEHPLVSIILITYNSSVHVLETLESCLAQTYRNIELIITDDSSVDDTLKICQDWLKLHQHKFVRTEIITIDKNMGVSANCNRGVKASRGEWIKLIAGDDILLSNCIEDYVNFLKSKPEAVMCLSKMLVFSSSGNNYRFTSKYNQIVNNFTSKTAKSQSRSYLRYPVMLNIPSVFIKTDLITELEGFDEEFKLLEDTPFLSKLFIKGYAVDFMNVFTVKYRRHEKNITAINNIAFETNLYKCYLKYARPNLRRYNLFDLLFLVYRDWYYSLKLKNKTTFFAVNFYKVSYVLSRFA